MYIGIDPGSKGAIAAWDGSRLRVWDMPMHVVTRGKTEKLRADLSGISRLASALSMLSPTLAVQEDVGGMPGQSAPAAFNFGWTCAATAMALAAHGVPFRLITPRVWKDSYGLKGEKDDAIALASQLFPAFVDYWTDRRGNGSADQRGGRAEAALIARYASTI